MEKSFYFNVGFIHILHSNYPALEIFRIEHSCPVPKARDDVEHNEVNSKGHQEPFCLRMEKKASKNLLGSEHSGETDEPQKSEYFEKTRDFRESKNDWKPIFVSEKPLQRYWAKKIKEEPAEEIIPEDLFPFDHQQIVNVVIGQKEVEEEINDEKDIDDRLNDVPSNAGVLILIQISQFVRCDCTRVENSSNWPTRH